MFKRLFASKNFKKKLGDLIKVATGGTLVFAGINIYYQNEKFYNSWVMPLLLSLDAETAHTLAVKAAQYRLVPEAKLRESHLLRSKLLNLNFRTPIGLAAGFDKHGEAVEGLWKMGFGFVEVGSVTPEAQPGNPQPRVFRLTSDSAVINSPNTPGLRNLQSQEHLEKLIEAVISARDSLPATHRPPLFLKIAPDLTDADMQDIATVVLQKKVDGLIVTNTTVTRPSSLTSPEQREVGGLSGQPLKDLSTRMVKEMYCLTKGQVPIIGVGGVACGSDAYEKIRAGASLVQLYTGLVYHGPMLVARITEELELLLRQDGFNSVAEAVGADAHTQ
ncbi:dihydroorotate dehydrogenase (quinone), mitochondrial-like isoform X2 [Scylla paramamosain]|uniref:dihydroorotate dehydrogenase (quinone), mitochondrial-like isoform X2 n=1 Tax=Scylla paramamosain TaxID=85552 RepID=UPI003083E713